MVNTLGAKNMLIFAVLTINEEPIAFLLGFNFRGRFIGYKPTYNIKFSSKYSPGLVLLKECIDYALDKESGCIEFDFSAGNATYKWRFANHAKKNRNITMYANGWDYTQARIQPLAPMSGMSPAVFDHHISCFWFKVNRVVYFSNMDIIRFENPRMGNNPISIFGNKWNFTPFHSFGRGFEIGLSIVTRPVGASFGQLLTS